MDASPAVSCVYPLLQCVRAVSGRSQQQPAWLSSLQEHSVFLLPTASMGQLQGLGVFGLRRNGCTGTAVAQAEPCVVFALE